MKCNSKLNRKSNTFYKFIRIFKIIVENPFLNIVVCLLLLYSGISETLRELKDLEEFKIGVHHGIILFATLHILKTLPDLFEGLEYIKNIDGEKN